MKDFIDLVGASGASYRFRLSPEGVAQAPIAGNYAYVREDEDGFTVVALGVTNDLSKARADWAKAAKQGATRVYLRLNVPRSVREAEHADLAARYKTARARETAA